MKQAIFLIALIAAMVMAVGAQDSIKSDAPVAVATVEAKATESGVDFSLPDTSGKTYTMNDLKGKSGTVIIFLSAQCPVVKLYNDRINQIAADYAAKGINFIGVNSNYTESLETVKTHATATYKFPMLIDKGNVFADKLGAKVTPEIYYYDAKGTLVYQGAIDNNKAETNITKPYLRNAFDQSLAGKKVERSSANAFGCGIKRVADAQ